MAWLYSTEMSSQSLFSRASSAMNRAKKKHTESLQKFISAFISEIDQSVISAAELGEWALSLEISKSHAYKKISSQNQYFPALGSR